MIKILVGCVTFWSPDTTGCSIMWVVTVHASASRRQHALQDCKPTFSFMTLQLCKYLSLSSLLWPISWRGMIKANIRRWPFPTQVSLSLVALAAGQVQIEGSPEWQVHYTLVIRVRWFGPSKQKTHKIKTGHTSSYVKLNFRVGLFSCIFWFSWNKRRRGHIWGMFVL